MQDDGVDALLDEMLELWNKLLDAQQVVETRGRIEALKHTHALTHTQAITTGNRPHNTHMFLGGGR